MKSPGLSLVSGLGISVAVPIGAGVYATTATMYAPLPLDEGNRVTGGGGPVVLAGVAAFMLVVGLVAALGPARRGLKIQPTEALKEL